MIKIGITKNIRFPKYIEKIIIQNVINSTFGIPERAILHTSITATIIPINEISLAVSFIACVFIINYCFV